MTPSDIIQAWKDPNYRAGLPMTQLAQLPAHPAGAIELPEPTLHAAWPQQGFRVKSDLRAGAPTANCTQQGQTCGNHNETLVRVAKPTVNCTQQGHGCSSTYGDNLWQDDLTQP